MIAHLVVAAFVAIALLLPGRSGAAELVAWDQAKVTALAKQLADASKNLYDTFYKQPVPTIGSGQSKDYLDLKQQVRRIQSEARELSSALEKGEGREETLRIYENLMQEVRDARVDARGVFMSSDVAAKSTVVRELLNQIGPYYDAGFEALEPVTR